MKQKFWIREQDVQNNTLRKVSQVTGVKRALQRLSKFTETYPNNHYEIFALANCTTPIAVGSKKVVEILEKVQ